jgi:hypothetical protein
MALCWAAAATSPTSVCLSSRRTMLVGAVGGGGGGNLYRQAAVPSLASFEHCMVALHCRRKHPSMTSVKEIMPCAWALHYGML